MMKSHHAPLPSLCQFGFISVQTEPASRAVDRYMLNSFQVVPQTWPTKHSQAKDTLAVFKRHSLESLRTETASRTARSGGWAWMVAQDWHVFPSIYIILWNDFLKPFWREKEVTKNSGGRVIKWEINSLTYVILIWGFGLTVYWHGKWT